MKFRPRVSPTNNELVSFVNDDWGKKRRNAARSNIRSKQSECISKTKRLYT